MIVTTSAIRVIPLFLLNVSFNIFLLPRFYFLFYINLSHLLYTYLSLPFLAFLYLTISSLIRFSMYINFWLFILYAFMLSYSVYFCNHFCIYFILHFYYKNYNSFKPIQKSLYIYHHLYITLSKKEEKFIGTPHNNAEIGQIAKNVIMPGDPNRAKLIAEKYLENYKLNCYKKYSTSDQY